MTTARDGWISLTGLTVDDALIGAYSEERDCPRSLSVNISMRVSLAAAALHDNLDSTVDYAAIAHTISTVIHARHYVLIEALAETIVAALLKEFEINEIKLELFKPFVVGGATASIMIHRATNFATPHKTIQHQG